MQRSSIGRPVALAGLLAFGLAIGLVLVEAGLQVAAFAIQRVVGDSLPGAWLTGGLRVLCLGDSNTYGLYVTREQAYPQRLEALWGEHVETPDLEVLNLAVGGTNSSRLLRDLPEFLDAFSPEVVLVMAGVNDSWTTPFEVEDGPESLAHFLKRSSKLYKLYHLIRRGSEVADPEVIHDPDKQLNRGGADRLRVGGREFDASWSKGSRAARWPAALRANLERLVRQVRAGGATPVLLTYPSRVRSYAKANKAIRQASKETQAPLIDLAKVFAARCKNRLCGELLFYDQHPRDAGHELAAVALLDALPQVLASASRAGL